LFRTSFQLPRIYVDLKVTQVYPLQGSLFGGTVLTIAGSGFGNNISNVNVTIETTKCHAINVTNFEIVCQLEFTGITHFVTNKGVDPGKYVAFIYLEKGVKKIGINKIVYKYEN
jgi:hypothetical protein